MNNSNILEGVFNQFLQSSNIFRDREVLRHDYIPNSLPHREGQIRHLGEIVAPILKGSRCSNIFIYGKTGTGKTAVVKYVLNKLGQKALELDASSVKISYVNCRLTGTEYRVFSGLCDAIDIDVPFTGLAVSEVFERFKRGLDEKSIVLMVVLDEIDALIKARGDIILYELTRMNETLNQSKTILIGISNDLRFKEFLDPRVLSSLSEEEIVFNPYDADELQDILIERARMAFYDAALSQGAIRLCSALAAAEHGDARRALALLRVAGEVAERENQKFVSEDHIRQAEKRIEHDRVIEALKNLPLHSKLVLCSVYLLSKKLVRQVVTGDIYEVYCELCNQSNVTPLTQRRVSGLINELDVIGLLNAQIVNMGRYGRTKKIRLSIAFNMLKDVFVNDSGFERLIAYTPKCLVDVH
jgi:cell division control protein 6